MTCFQDTHFYEQEAGERKFDELGDPAANVVVKRTAGSYKRLPDLPRAISLLYCLRHPADVLTSSHSRTKHLRRFHVTMERWDEEYEALKMLREKQPRREICYVRYEDLVRTPDAVQQRIGRAFGLSVRIRFSEDPNKPIVDTSLEKWRTNEEFLHYVRSLPPPFLKRVGAFCDEFDYEVP